MGCENSYAEPRCSWILCGVLPLNGPLQRTPAESTDPAGDHRRRTDVRQICCNRSDQPDHGNARLRGRGTMQALDSVHELLGQRCCGFKNHATPRMPCRKRTAVEAKPGDRVNELALAIDEVRDPESAVVQEDRRHAALTQAEHLALKGARECLFWVVVQRG